jgi:hypothetical protein
MVAGAMEERIQTLEQQLEFVTQQLRAAIEAAPSPPLMTMDVPAGDNRPRVSASRNGVRSFSGKEDELMTWFTHVEGVFEYDMVYQEERRVGLARTLLHGAAGAWLAAQDNCGVVYHTWNDLKRALLASFQPPNALFAYRERLAALKMTGRNLGDYINNFRVLVAYCHGMNEVDQIHGFVIGLQEDVRKFVRVGRPPTLDMAIQRAREYIGAYAYDKLETHQILQASDVAPQQPHHSVQPMDLDTVIN